MASHGFVIDEVAGYDSADTAVSISHYGLVIVQDGLGGSAVDALLTRIRRHGDTTTAVLVLVAGGSRERLSALIDAGCDDAMPMPVEPRELHARVLALLRRKGTAASSDVRVGDLQIDLAQRRVRNRGRTVRVGSRGWALLMHLAFNVGAVVSMQALSEGLSSFESETSRNVIEVALCRLRRRIEGSGAEIRSLRGNGLRLQPSTAGAEVAFVQVAASGDATSPALARTPRPPDAG